jgi:glutaredoxin
MEDYFTVYIKEECPWCAKALVLLSEQRESYMTVNVINMSEAHRDNIKEFMGWDTFPMVLYHEADVPPRLLGGCTELFDFFNLNVEDTDDTVQTVANAAV